MRHRNGKRTTEGSTRVRRIGNCLDVRLAALLVLTVVLTVGLIVFVPLCPSTARPSADSIGLAEARSADASGPTISAINPSQGTWGQSLDITITGTRLKGATAVTINGVSVNSFTVRGSTGIKASISVGSASVPGTKDVSVTTSGGSATLTGGFTVLAIPPTLTSVSPNHGNPGQALDLTIGGSRLGGATAVTISGIAVDSFTVSSDSQIRARVTVDSGASRGSRDVSVTTPGGAATLANGFAVVQESLAPASSLPPTITSVSPSQGTWGQTLDVTVAGTYFTGATSVTISGITVNSFTVRSDAQVTANIYIPSITPGLKNVRVYTGGGTAVLNNSFTVVAPPPVIGSVSPSEAAQGQTLEVAIAGAYFTGATAVTITGTAVNSFTVHNDTQITVSITIGSVAGPGSKDVSVTTAGGTVTFANGFAVVEEAPAPPPTPTISSASPSQGTQGRTLDVTISGANFTGATAVTISGITVNGFTVNSDTQVAANIYIPPITPGLKNVRVYTPGGTAVLYSSFTVLAAPPSISSVSPSQGSQGQTLNVAITGAYFTGATAVTISGATVNSFTVGSAAEITANISIAADAVPEAKDVSVTAPGGTAVLQDGFTLLLAAPSVSSVSPIQGTQGQTLDITIIGTRLEKATAVAISGATVNSYTVDSAIKITANIFIPETTVPGARDVTVSTPGGAAALSRGFTVVKASGTPTTGTLVITTTPVGAAVSVDGASVGSTTSTTNLEVELAAGTHTVSFGSVSGYSTPSSQAVVVPADDSTRVYGVYVAPTGLDTDLTWMGYNWHIRDYQGSPGPCYYSASNVWIDSKGYLHLKISYDSKTGTWTCAEIMTTVSLSFGTYIWTVQTPVNNLDRNVVLGLFPHQKNRIYQYTNELDIEFCKWSQSKYDGVPRVQYTINTRYPQPDPYEATDYPPRVHASAAEPARAAATTNKIIWAPDYCTFEGKYADTGAVWASFTFPGSGWNIPHSLGGGSPTITDPGRTIPTVPMLTMMDLWLTGASSASSQAPSDGKEVEIVITDFTYTPDFTPDSTPDSPIPAPTLVSPAKGASVAGNSVTFDWKAVAEAVDYRLLVSTSRNPLDTTKYKCNIRTGSGDITSYVDTGYPANGARYYWWVWAYNAEGNWSLFSKVMAKRRSFSTTPVYIGAPALISPAKGEAVTANSMKFEWAAVDGAVDYKLLVSTSTNPLDTTKHKCNVRMGSGDITSYVDTGYPANGARYYWWVWAYNAEGNWSAWSEVNRNVGAFTITPVYIGAPTLVSPTYAAVGSSNTVTFEWAAVDGAVDYRLLVSTSTNPLDTTKYKCNVTMGSGDVTSYVDTGYPADGTGYQRYYWWVWAYNAEGNWSLFSEMKGGFFFNPA